MLNARQRDRLRGVVYLILSYVPCIVAFEGAEHTIGPLQMALVIAAYILTFAAVGFSYVAVRGAFPYPDSFESWAAAFNEALADVTFFTSAPCLILITYCKTIVQWLLRIVHLLFEVPSFPGAARILDFIKGRYVKVIYLHCSVATKKGELSITTTQNLFAVHHNLAELGAIKIMFARGQEDAAKEIREAVGHARLALFYASLMGFRSFRFRSPLRMHLLLTSVYLTASLKADSSDSIVLLETGLSILADAIQIRWFHWEGRASRLNSPERKSLAIIVEIAQNPNLIEDIRLRILLDMFQNGTAAKSLDEIRTQIPIESSETRLAPNESEREELQWAEALMNHLNN